MLWEQFIRPSLKAVRTLVIRPLQGYGNTASLSYPDTWVRKPDCLHLPYNFSCMHCLMRNLAFSYTYKLLTVTLLLTTQHLLICTLSYFNEYPNKNKQDCFSLLAVFTNHLHDPLIPRRHDKSFLCRCCSDFIFRIISKAKKN